MMQSELQFQKLPVKKTIETTPKNKEWKIERRKQRKFKQDLRKIGYENA